MERLLNVRKYFPSEQTLVLIFPYKTQLWFRKQKIDKKTNPENNLNVKYERTSYVRAVQLFIYLKPFHG